ncbi:putative phosphoesterase [Breznakia sp. PF5-3]|uniref:phosphodiesterase n=1 Tax=unclassified Breznakia TaxID=2623764 RepID=UPI002406D0E3|nr:MULTISPECIES: phosphodiesterase [unclassified Breznakia]MDF9823663.1 putative phosphoesterase [Breznakia sp. PM6-1]MDF9834461.1 putative phosphoesterase [Breznakia sp. PF5-3]
MKFLIVSDIHGSAYYAQKAIDAFHKFKCDKILLLGDILYHGPRNPLPKDYDPKKVIALLNPLSNAIIACRGNCDSEVDQMVLSFPITNDSQTIPLQERSIFISHGHIYNPDRLPENIKDDDIFLFGHIHIPIMEKQQQIHIINPGSISLPKENTPHTFGILEGDAYEWIDVDYNILNTYKLK